jgi:hypothetical protein
MQQKHPKGKLKHRQNSQKRNYKLVKVAMKIGKMKSQSRNLNPNQMTNRHTRSKLLVKRKN